MIRTFSLLTLSILSLFFLQSCHEKRTTENQTTDITGAIADTTAPFWGVYEDTIPCADCGGIVTRLFLNKDFTYIKEENYLGIADSAQHIFYDLGKWQVKDSSVHLSAPITGTDGGYKILQDGSLEMFAENGQPMPDSIKNDYVLRLRGKVFTPMKPFLVSGIINRETSNSTLKICAWDKTFQITFSPKSQHELDSLWTFPDKETAVIQAEVFPDAHHAEYLHITQVSNVIEGNSCK